MAKGGGPLPGTRWIQCATEMTFSWAKSTSNLFTVALWTRSVNYISSLFASWLHYHKVCWYLGGKWKLHSIKLSIFFSQIQSQEVLVLIQHQLHTSPFWWVSCNTAIAQSRIFACLHCATPLNAAWSAYIAGYFSLQATIYSRTDTFSDRRLQKTCRHWDSFRYPRLLQYAGIENYVWKYIFKTTRNFFCLPRRGKAVVLALPLGLHTSPYHAAAVTKFD